MSKNMSVAPDNEPEEDAPIPDVPQMVTIGNRRYKRKKGARSSYADRLRELQKEKEEHGD